MYVLSRHLLNYLSICIIFFPFSFFLLLQSKAGPVLIAVNPFKDVELYGNEFITAYRQKLVDGPHVYSIADAAYTEMMEGVR